MSSSDKSGEKCCEATVHRQHPPLKENGCAVVTVRNHSLPNLVDIDDNAQNEERQTLLSDDVSAGKNGAKTSFELNDITRRDPIGAGKCVKISISDNFCNINIAGADGSLKCERL
jgi:hypothetical protein